MNKYFKNLLALLFMAIVFSSCASNDLQKKEPKEVLIQKANSGDVKAMISLEEDYNIVNTKNGIFYLEKWHKLLNEKNDKKDLAKLHKIYEKYKFSIANAKEVRKKILELSKEKEGFEGFFYKLEKAVEQRDRKKLEELVDKKYKNLNNEQLNRVVLYFDLARFFPKRLNLVKYMEEKKYILPYEYYHDKMRYVSKNKEEKELVIKRLLSFEDEEGFEETILYFIEKKEYENAYRFLKRLEEFTKNQANTYYLYAKLEKKKNPNSIEVINYYKKAVNLAHYEASKHLIYYFAKNKKYKEFIKVEKENKDNLVFLKALADFYRYNRQESKAIEIYEKAAKLGDKESIAFLVSFDNPYEFTPQIIELKQKYQEYVLSSNDWELFDKVLAKTTYFENQKKYKEFNKKIFDILIKNNRFLELKKFAVRLDDKKEKLFYLEEAAKMGDVQANVVVAKHYIEDYDNPDVKKAIKIFDELVDREELYAIRVLAKLYHKPTYKVKKYKDEKKAIKYLELLSKRGDLKARRNILKIYAKNKELIDYNKAITHLKELIKENDNTQDRYELAQVYLKMENFDKSKLHLNKLIKKGYKRAYVTLGMMYYKDENYDNPVEKIDHKKAFEYFKKAEKSSSLAWYFLGVFYKNGYATEKDLEKAKYYFEKAYTFGVEHAKKELED